MTSRLMYIGVILVVLIGIAVAISTVRPPVSTPVITTFEECAALYPVMESYPEQCSTPDGKHFVRKIENDKSDLIRVTLPKSNDVVTSPVTISGEARGNWYFEASFPVRLIDAAGNILAEQPMQAQGDWMTTEFVPFMGTLEFKTPLTETGTLILQKDNPSGLPEHDDKIEIPVRFITAVGAVKTATLGDPVTLSIGDKADFSGELRLVLLAINDSRCKPTVQCIWQGELSAQLQVIERTAEPVAGVPAKSIQLGTVNNKIASTDFYRITLQSATETSATIVVELK